MKKEGRKKKGRKEGKEERKRRRGREGKEQQAEGGKQQQIAMKLLQNVEWR